MSGVMAGGNRTAAAVARRLYDGFVTYHDAFHTITTQAQARFERRDWPGAQVDASTRIALYKQCADDAEHRVAGVPTLGLACTEQGRVLAVGLLEDG